MIANNARKTARLFVQGYNLEVHDVIEYRRVHRATVTNYITCKPGFVWRSKQKPLQAIITFGEIRTLLKEYRRTRKGMKDKRNHHGAVGKSSSE